MLPTTSLQNRPALSNGNKAKGNRANGANGNRAKGAKGNRANGNGKWLSQGRQRSRLAQRADEFLSAGVGCDSLTSILGDDVAWTRWCGIYKMSPATIPPTAT